jgi:hypothetical protein
MGELRVHYRSDQTCVATLDGFFLMRCYGVVTLDALEATLRAHEEALYAEPRGVCSIMVADPTSRLPPEEVREASATVTRKTKATVRASATIMLGEGFWASAVRGYLATLQLMSPSGYPKKIFRYEDEGVDWTIKCAEASPARYKSKLLDALAQMTAADARVDTSGVRI